MKKAVALLVLACMFLSACTKGIGKSEDVGQSPVEKIEVSFVNSVETADVWFIADTQENRKTSVWGTASVKGTEVEKGYSVRIPKSEDGSYLFRMIDVDHAYYEANGITIADGYSIVLYKSDDGYGDI